MAAEAVEPGDGHGWKNGLRRLREWNGEQRAGVNGWVKRLDMPVSIEADQNQADAGESCTTERGI